MIMFKDSPQDKNNPSEYETMGISEIAERACRASITVDGWENHDPCVTKEDKLTLLLDVHGLSINGYDYWLIHPFLVGCTEWYNWHVYSPQWDAKRALGEKIEKETPSYDELLEMGFKPW